jgi:O-antigen ligase
MQNFEWRIEEARWQHIRPFLFVLLALLAGAAIALLPQGQLALLAGGALALVAALAIFAEPALGIALVMLAGPFQPLERVALQLPLDSGQIILGITLLAYLFRALITRQLPITNDQSLISSLKSPVFIALALFIFICLLSFFPARDFSSWANECIKWLQMAILALLVANEPDERKRALIVGAILLSAAGQALYGIIQADVRGFGPKEFQVLGSKTNFRAYGTFEQPNPFGGYMGLTWPLAAAVAAWAFLQWKVRRGESEKGRKWESGKVGSHLPTFSLSHFLVVGIAAFATTALCLLALQASGSRGALIGAGFAVVVMALALVRKPALWLALFALAAFLLFAFDRMDVIPAGVRNQINTLVEDYGSLDVRDAYITPITFSTIERLAHWQAAIRMIESNPWLGIGFGNYAPAYPDYRLQLWENALGHAHNYYLNIFAETGAVGFLTYLAFWLTAFVVAFRVVRRKKLSAWHSALALGALGAFAHAAGHHLFDNLYVANMHMLLGVYLGFVIAAAAKMDSTSKVESI